MWDRHRQTPVARPPYVARLTRGKSSSPRRAEHKWRRPGTLDTGWQSVDSYPGAMLCRHLYTWIHTFEPKPVINIQQWSSRCQNWLSPRSLIVLVCVGDDLGCSIENTLQLVGRLLWRTDQETATVVDPAGNERVDDSSGWVVVERASQSCWSWRKHLASWRGHILVKGQIRR